MTPDIAQPLTACSRSISSSSVGAPSIRDPRGMLGGSCFDSSNGESPQLVPLVLSSTLQFIQSSTGPATKRSACNLPVCEVRSLPTLYAKSIVFQHTWLTSLGGTSKCNEAHAGLRLPESFCESQPGCSLLLRVGLG